MQADLLGDRVRGRGDWLLMVCLSLAALCAGCGGGGGGSAGSREAEKLGVRVLHAAIDAAPVDVFIPEVTTPVAQQAFFGVDNGFHRIPAGQLNLLITRTGRPDVVVGVIPAEVSAESKLSVLLYGDNGTFGLRTVALQEPPRPRSDRAQVRFVDGVTGAATVQFTVRVGVTTGDAVEVPFGSASTFSEVAPGPVVIRAARSVDGRVLASQTVQLEAGKVYSFLVAGEAEYFVKGLLLEE